MCDYSNQASIRREALSDMIRIAEEAGLYESEALLYAEAKASTNLDGQTINIGSGEITGYPAAFVRTLSDEVDNLNSMIVRVRALHKEIDANDSVCGDPDCCGEYIEDWTMCADCLSDYPCPTIKALDGEQENKRKCEVHDWKTYGTFGQQCTRCDFTHDFS